MIENMNKKTMDYSQEELEVRARRANRYFDAMVNGFNKATKGQLPIIKKQTAESLMKGRSEELKKLFMSRIDLS